MSEFLPGLFTLMEDDLTLIPLVAQRIYSFPAPQGAASPFITLQIVNSLPTRTFDGPTFDDWSVQIDCWVIDQPVGKSKNKLLEQVTKAVRSLLDDFGGIMNGKEVMLVQYDSERDLPSDTSLRRQLDFTFKVKR